MNILKSISFWLISSCVILGCACSASKDEPETPKTVDPPTLTEPVISSIDVSAFTAFSSIKGPVDAITSAGFCYSTSGDPTTADSKVSAAVTSNSITAEISGLSEATNYTVKAYAVYDGKVYYSKAATTTTASAKPASPTPDEVLSYRGPSYADDYRKIAAWGDRARWNLANVHDPTVMLADDGYYYMYQTDASFGNAHLAGGHFHGRRSRDLVNWEYLGGTMSTPPAWVMEKTNEYREILGLPKITRTYNYGYWAPCARNLGNGTYRMYYSIVNDECLIEDGAWPERSFIGMMETKDPASNVWEDKGFVICAASDRGTNWKRPSNQQWYAYNRWNAIDPSFIITPEGEHWLIYGSWHCGLAAVQLDPVTGKVKDDLPNPWGTKAEIAPYGKLVATRDLSSRWQGSEGPEVVYHDGYYYLFMAYDGLDVPYNTRVVRSTKVDGPYVDMYGTNVSQNGGDAFPIVTHPYKFADSPGWVGISHCAVFDDGKGNWYYASQARFPTDYDDWAPNAIMLGHVRAIRWSGDGWPLVMPERYGKVPQIAINEAEIPGVWEHIDMAYNYGKQKTSSTMTFAADNTITDGAWKGAKWTFDPEKQSLTLSNGIVLYLMRECDWEATDRPATIVYVALGNKKTYWGKRCK